MGSAFGDYGIGLVGGLIYLVTQSFLGSGFIGSLAAPLAAGSFLKGPRGQIIATITGFYAAAELMSGGLGNLFGGGGGGSADEVM
jgi:hypothetical protein